MAIYGNLNKMESTKLFKAYVILSLLNLVPIIFLYISLVEYTDFFTFIFTNYFSYGPLYYLLKLIKYDLPIYLSYLLIFLYLNKSSFKYSLKLSKTASYLIWFFLGLIGLDYLLLHKDIKKFNYQYLSFLTILFYIVNKLKYNLQFIYNPLFVIIATLLLMLKLYYYVKSCITLSNNYRVNTTK